MPQPAMSEYYPDVQAFMATYREAEAVVEQYNRSLAEWERQVKEKRRPQKPPERESVRNRLRQLQEQGRQQPHRKKSFDRDSRQAQKNRRYGVTHNRRLTQFDQCSCFWMTVICKSFASISVSCLHFGQYRGSFFKTVSSRILLCVFLPQMGQIIHSVCIFYSLLVFFNILPVGIVQNFCIFAYKCFTSFFISL